MIGFIDKKYMCHFDDIYDLAISLNEFADKQSCNVIYITDNQDYIHGYIKNGQPKLPMSIDTDRQYLLYGYFQGIMTDEEKIPEKGNSVYEYGESFNQNWVMMSKLWVFADSTKLVEVPFN